MDSLAEAIHILNAAEGWLLLGDWRSAEAELQSLSSSVQALPGVLKLQASILMEGRQWERMTEVCQKLVAIEPGEPYGWIHRSYALHELKRTLEACEALQPARATFPDNWLIHYNMACYASQLGRLAEAADFLKLARKLGDAKEIDKMAKEDPDLVPILFKPS